VTGPGLAKTRGLPLILARKKLLYRTEDARWRDLFDSADVVSEGSMREETNGQMWYGSTSLILPPHGDPILLAALAERDVHLRVRALRTALREASVRAPSRLGRLACEIRVRSEGNSVRIDVDVQAPLIERVRSSRRAP
jgi:hypothetical protein